MSNATQATGFKATLSAIFSAAGSTIITACNATTRTVSTVDTGISMVEAEMNLARLEQELDHEESLDKLMLRKAERRAKQANMSIEDYLKANPEALTIPTITK